MKTLRKPKFFVSSKSQAICIGKNAHDNITSFNIDSVEIKCDDNVTLLGVNIDFCCVLMTMYLKFVRKLLNNLLF